MLIFSRVDKVGDFDIDLIHVDATFFNSFNKESHALSLQVEGYAKRRLLMLDYFTQIKEICDTLTTCGNSIPMVEQIETILS